MDVLSHGELIVRVVHKNKSGPLRNAISTGVLPERLLLSAFKAQEKIHLSKQSNVFCSHEVCREPMVERYTPGFNLIPERYEALNATGSASLSGPDLFPVDCCS